MSLPARYAAALTDEDAAGRTAALRQILTDGFVFEGPVFEAYGLDDFLNQIGLWHAMLPAGTKFLVAFRRLDSGTASGD